MTWRYQPVWVHHKETNITSYSMCEVYLTKDGKLKQWTQSSGVTPHGNDIDDLRGSLANMISDAFKWKAVEFRKLRVGMTFERL